MRPFATIVCTVCLLAAAAPAAAEDDPATWRAAREERLRAENGWLALVGRFELSPGPNTIGTASDCDVVFPAALAGSGPPRLGAVVVDLLAGTVTLVPAGDARFVDGAGPVTPPRVLAVDEPDWVGIGRFRFQVIQRGGRHYLRLADNESPARRDFPGCRWYEPDEGFRIEATYVAHEPGDAIDLVDVAGNVAARPCPGHAEFTVAGERLRLDAVAEEGGLFFVFRDATAGDTTHAGGRFLSVPGTPADGATFTLDFNRAYNPPCAISAHTTCPTPPARNRLPVRIEAGERRPPAGPAGETTP
ncbi:MAG: DUF1684 domain-containing protein [Planctomycetaceae bacterium]